MTFEQYCIELDQIARSSDGYYSDLSKSMIKDTGLESWKGYYEDDYSPQQAWDEMMSYGE